MPSIFRTELGTFMAEFPLPALVQRARARGFENLSGNILEVSNVPIPGQPDFLLGEIQDQDGKIITLGISRPEAERLAHHILGLPPDND